MTDIAAERAAWRAYAAYVHMRARGNRASTLVFMGDDHSRHLWLVWRDLYRRVIARRWWRRRGRKSDADLG